MAKSPGAKVLVVEDDRATREGLAELIRVWGYRSETASDGVEALEKLRDSHPVVLISDLHMPRMGGIELLKAVRTRAPHVSCILLTSERDAEKTAVLRAAGAVDLLEKPVDVRTLRQDLQRCFKQSSGSA